MLLKGWRGPNNRAGGLAVRVYPQIEHDGARRDGRITPVLHCFTHFCGQNASLRGPAARCVMLVMFVVNPIACSGRLMKPRLRPAEAATHQQKCRAAKERA